MEGVHVQDALVPASPDVLLCRRLRTRLTTLGGAVIALSVWTMAKSLIIIQQYQDEIKALMQSLDLNPDILVFATVVIAMIGTAVECYVGHAARVEGGGQRRTAVYLVVAVMATLIYALGVASDIFIFATGEGSFVDAFANVGIDLTGVVTLTILIVTAVRVRRLARQVES